MFTIRKIDNREMTVIIPLLLELNGSVTQKELEERLPQMILSGYECVGVYDNQKLIGISGMWFLTKYYIGKHLEPDNVFISPEYRGKGVGNLLIEWIHRYAKSKNCVALELNCYIDNADGNKFWKSQGYKEIGYHFRKEL